MDNRKDIINKIISEKIKLLNVSEEDTFLINNLVNSYYRKRIGVSNSAPNTMASAFLWIYSKSNFLSEGDKKWSLQRLAELFGSNSKTAGDVASKISKILKIRLWDERFCRQSIMKDNPFDKFVMSPSGFIVSKDMFNMQLQNYEKQSKTKEDYLDDAISYLEQDKKEKAIEYLNKSLALDENYIKAINELGFIYFFKDLKKSREYFKRSLELSKNELGGAFPKKLEWTVFENRPYMIAIQSLGLINWRENNIKDAKEFFKLLLDMNPNDNQGIRYCMAFIYKGLTWDDFGKIEEECSKKGDYKLMDTILQEQNSVYKFWRGF